MIHVLGDLLLDYSVRIDQFPIEAGSMQPASYLELGPGGAANVAIVLARLGLQVGYLAELGGDLFGEIIRGGLEREGIETSALRVSPDARTPVANVIVDRGAEPAYLGFPGTLRMRTLPPEWKRSISTAQALFADGWIDQGNLAAIVLDALDAARAAGVPVFFDPGPGNHGFDMQWHLEAARKATVLLATEAEAHRLSGREGVRESGRALLDYGAELVVIKRGGEGCVLLTKDEIHAAPAYPVTVRDATGAGDSLDAAVMYAWLKGLSLERMGQLANAAGAAKVQKMGTGHNVPTRDEIRQVLAAHIGGPAADF
jgi:ribokinase